jgi:hypothetical protein
VSHFSFFSETGTEGGWWAMQEDGYLSEDGVHWSYDDIRELKEGDDFTLYADDGSVLWHSIIRQDKTTGLIPRQVFRNGKLVNHRTWKQQVVGGMWVHWVQAGIDPEVWGRAVRRRQAVPTQTGISGEDTDE